MTPIKLSQTGLSSAVDLAGRFSILYEAAAAISGVLEPAALARVVMESTRQVLGVDGVTLRSWDVRAKVLRLLADEPGPVAVPLRLKPGQGATGVAFLERRPVVVDDYGSWEHAVEWLIKAGVRSVLAVPLVAGNEVVGSLSLQSFTPREFTPEDVQMLSLLAVTVGPALLAVRLHAEVANSEEHLRSLYDHMACAVVVQGAEGQVLHANPAAQQIAALSLSQMVGHQLDELWDIYSESGANMGRDRRPALVAARTRRPVRNAVVRMVTASGAERWLQADIIPLLGSEGELIRMVSSFVDITERRRAEEALRDSEGRFRAIFEWTAIGIMRVALDGQIIEVNPAQREMLGYIEGEMEKLRFQDLVPLEDFDPTLVRTLARGEQDHVQVEMRYLHQDGHPVWVNWIGSLVRGASGEPIFLFGISEDITARKAQEASLEHMALHDSLTGLPNRTLLQNRLRQAIAAAQQEGQALILLVMDLDRFKDVNDTFGHHRGDQLLREVTERLRGTVREIDTVARMGGDEFAVLMPGLGRSRSAAAAAVKLLSALQEPFVVETEALEVTASVGVAVYPTDGDNPETLLRRADMAMYAAKRANQPFALYTSDLDSVGRGRFSLAQEMRRGIEANQLRLHYQPIVDLASQRVRYVEALVRWQHPRLGLLKPDRFVEVAEDSGLIGQLGAWVLEEAVRQCRAWKQDGIDVKVAINVSARSLFDAELVPNIERVLNAHEMGADCLMVEMTESTLMGDPIRSLRTLEHLNQMGVELAVDDFGTGYSSLTLLQRLSVDEIKIDKSFVLDMARIENSAVIVRSTVELGHNLNLRVVAEGVEDERTLDLLKRYGCDLAQGYHLGRPMTATRIHAKLR